MAAQPATTQTQPHFGIGQIAQEGYVLRISTNLEKLVACLPKIATNGIPGDFVVNSCPVGMTTPHAITEFVLGEIQRLLGILVGIINGITFTWVELHEMTPLEKLEKWSMFHKKYTAYHQVSTLIQEIIKDLPFEILPKQMMITRAFEEHQDIDLTVAQDALIRINENCKVNVAIIELFMVSFRDKIETESVRDAHLVGFRAAVETLKQ